jgi:hypothetical protein
VNILIQLAKDNAGEKKSAALSSRFLRMFCLHKSIFVKEQKIFNHYLLAIGYAGGGSQETCFYKIEGSDLIKSKISIATSIGDYYFQHKYDNQVLTGEEFELLESDSNAQNELIDNISNYLHYDEAMECYVYNNDCNFIKNKEFEMNSKFPLKTLSFLKDVYWPFSTYW